MYAFVKHIHIVCVALSLGGFVARAAYLVHTGHLPRPRWLRILPHINDSILLLAAMTLATSSGCYPFYNCDWLSAKVLGLLLYIGLGVLAFKTAQTRRRRIAYSLAAVLVFLWIVSVARLHRPAGFLGAVSVLSLDASAASRESAHA